MIMSGHGSHQRSVSYLQLLILFGTVVSLIAGCASSTPSPLSLSPGNYTPLGGVQKNNQPTPSDLTDLQAAETGTLKQPVVVEFYADY